MTQGNIGIYLFLIIGIVILGFVGYWFVVTLKRKLRKFKLLNCKVIDHKKQEIRLLDGTGTSFNIVFSTVVKYRDGADLEQKIYTDPLRLCYRRHKVGKHLEILVDPEGKQDPILNTFLSKYLGMLVCSLIGIIFL
jgi:hypothetical protein